MILGSERTQFTNITINFFNSKFQHNVKTKCAKQNNDKTKQKVKYTLLSRVTYFL